MAIYSFEDKLPQLGARVWVHETAYVSGDVILGEDVSVWPNATIRGDVATIRVGARSNVQDNAVLHATHASEMTAPEGHPTTIGEDVIIGHGAVVHGCTIGDEVLVGMNATVLDGAVVEKHVLIAAGALVPPNAHLKSGYLYAGMPAKALRKLSEKEKTFFTYSAGHYVALAKCNRETSRRIDKNAD